MGVCDHHITSGPSFHRICPILPSHRICLIASCLIVLSYLPHVTARQPHLTIAFCLMLPLYLPHLTIAFCVILPPYLPHVSIASASSYHRILPHLTAHSASIMRCSVPCHAMLDAMPCMLYHAMRLAISCYALCLVMLFHVMP